MPPQDQRQLGLRCLANKASDAKLTSRPNAQSRPNSSLGKRAAVANASNA